MAVLGSARRAARMVADLLDFTRAKLAGGIPIHTTRCDLGAIAEKVVAEIRQNSPDRKFCIDVAGDCCGEFDCDRVAQVVANLVDNAVTHSSTSEPVLVRVAGTSGAVVLEVVTTPNRSVRTISINCSRRSDGPPPANVTVSASVSSSCTRS